MKHSTPNANPASLLRDLIAIPSVNPAFPGGDASWVGEHKVAEYLVEIGRKAKFEIEKVQILPNRENILLRFRTTETPKYRVVLAPHMDTVTVTSGKQLKPRVSGGRIYGRGACDTKGSIAAMLSAMLQLSESPSWPLETEIVLAALVDEENGQLGSRALVKNKFQADFAVVGEPTECKLITAHKGDLWLLFETTGKSAHGARPELGKNAVHEMAKIVTLLEEDYAEILARRKNTLLGSPTISVGTITGGHQANIVPNRCLMSADRRTIPGETEVTVRQEIQKLLKKHHLNARLANSKSAPCLPMETDFSNRWVQLFLKTNRQQKKLGVDYFCDASVLASGGIPSAIFGPGNIAQAHTADEWLSLQQLETATARLLKFFQHLP